VDEEEFGKGFARAHYDRGNYAGLHSLAGWIYKSKFIMGYKLFKHY
jgi:hypothetical protein